METNKVGGANVREARLARGLSQLELARRTQISRQALGAIEGGVYQPSVTVALKLAEELGATVETLFGESRREHLAAEDVAGVCKAKTRVCLARIGGRVAAIAAPFAGMALNPPAGIVAKASRGRRVEVAPFRSTAEIELTLVVAGCDPGVAILRDFLARSRPVIALVALPASSQEALNTAARGGAHAAGVHLRDPGTGEYNGPAARAAFGTRPFRMINFAQWELGLAARRDHPVAGAQELAQRGVRLINRPAGSGARAALDEALAGARIKASQVEGYGRTVEGHLEVAAAIAAGIADAGVTIRVAAELYGLAFQPWREERYDLVIPEDELEVPLVQQLLGALNTSTLAHEIAAVCAYDTRRMGAVAAP